VVIEHAGNLLPYKLAKISNLLVFDGVSIFFVLSGFLIGGILLKQYSEPPSKKLLIDFWMRRWMRTLPNYFLILILLCVLHTLLDAEFKIQNTGRYFIFSQNLFQKHPRFFPEAWSLSVEVLPIDSNPVIHFHTFF
jgi:peptidoglycan/LPS O-acetylase OafA/YrhL